MLYRTIIPWVLVAFVLLGVLRASSWSGSSRRPVSIAPLPRATATERRGLLGPTVTPTATASPLTPIGTGVPTARPSSTPPVLTPAASASPASTQSARTPGPGTATVADPPTTQEAETVVRAYFDAAERDDYDAVRATTSGNARLQTDELIAQIEQQARDQNATIDLRVMELSTRPLPAEPPLQPVQADFLVEAYADLGLFSVRAREIRSSSTFRVARTPEGVRIVDIQNPLVT